MFRVSRVIVNENGNTIEMTVSATKEGVTYSAKGPHSQVEHSWTPAEAANLLDLMQIASNNMHILEF